MNDEAPEDASLLRQYTAGSEAAFRELVQRHLGMVRATARRILSPAPHLADDVAQNVFTDLAKTAAALPTGTVLAGWLHRHTCFLAMNAARAEHRRRARERTAMEITALNENSPSDAQWARLAPVLDDALDHLEPADRDAIVLRYLEQYDLRRVGLALGTSDDTAQKRVARALEKLRGLLTRRGVTMASVTALGSTLEAGVTVVTPAELAATVSTTALRFATEAGPSLFSLKTMFTSKFIIGAAVALVTAVLTILVVSHQREVTSTQTVQLSATHTSVAALPTSPAATGTPVAGATAPADPADLPEGSILPNDNTAGPDPFGASSDPFGPASTTDDSSSSASTELPAETAAAAAPAAETPSGSGDSDGSKRMLTVNKGQLMMTVTYANGTVSTTPYKEAGATVTISDGDQPHTHVLTFRNETSGRIAAIIRGVPESPADSVAGGNTTGK